jgi:hypothetical protein
VDISPPQLVGLGVCAGRVRRSNGSHVDVRLAKRALSRDSQETRCGTGGV